jgi:hypothetical protein
MFVGDCNAPAVTLGGEPDASMPSASLTMRWHADGELPRQTWQYVHTVRFVGPKTDLTLKLDPWRLPRAAEAAELLGRDDGRREHWLEIANKIAPYPTVKTDASPILTDVADVNPPGVAYNQEVEHRWGTSNAECIIFNAEAGKNAQPLARAP